MRVTRARAVAIAASALTIGGSGARVRAQTRAVVHAAVVPSEGAAEAFYAKEMGFFAKVGLDVDVQTIASGVPAAIASSTVDIGYATLDALASAHRKGVPLVAFAPAAEYLSSAPLCYALVVPASSPITHAVDLSGKVIAQSTLQGISENSTRAWLDANGGDPASVKFIEVPFPAMPAALTSGRIDAAFLSEPFLTVARKNGRILGDPFGAIAKHFLISTWATTPAWAAAHPDLVRRYATAIRETAVWANKNPARTAEIVAKYLKIEPAVIAAMSRSRYGDALSPALVQPVIDVSAKYARYEPFPAKELLAPA